MNTIMSLAGLFNPANIGLPELVILLVKLLVAVGFMAIGVLLFRAWAVPQKDWRDKPEPEETIMRPSKAEGGEKS
jgi:hypothetical protein